MTSLPLIRYSSPTAPLAQRDGEILTAADFIRDVRALAAVLPAGRPVINLCRDRYRFAVGLGAALLHRQLTLLPPNETPGLLSQLAQDYPGAYVLTDTETGNLSVPVIVYDTAKTGDLSMDVPAFPASQPAIVLFTSGSTGQPRPQQRDWGTLVNSARAAGHRLGIQAMTGATLLGTVPHQHSYGIESTIMLALQHGLALETRRPLLPADIETALAEIPRPRLLVTAPIHLRALVAEGRALPPVDFILSATAPLSPQLAAAAEEKFAAPLYEIYGCSEAGQLATRRTTAGAEWHCLDGAELAQDEAGTWVSGSLIPGRILLNDVIELNDNSHFTLHGRTADIINIAGKRSSLAHLNYHLNAIPGVEDGVFLMPDNEDDNHRLMAFVVATALTVPEILAALRQHLDPAFLPRPLHLVAALPRNELGKLRREDALQLIETAS
jgi:acyl-coenzyme A synthetase/AMP-(fatty) acid ligase